MIEAAPRTPAIARANRAFLRRAVRYMAGDAGIDQFIDIGCGLPTQGNVHQVARSVRNDAKVVYVDNDPMVLVHARALLATDENTVAVEGDLVRPEALLADPRLREVIDLDRPVGLLLISVAHCVSDHAQLKGAVGTLCEALAPGSHVALSHISLPTSAPDQPDQQDVARRGAQVYESMKANTGMTFRDRGQLTELLGGLELLEPGLVDLPDCGPSWRTRMRRRPRCRTVRTRDPASTYVASHAKETADELPPHRLQPLRRTPSGGHQSSDAGRTP